MPILEFPSKSIGASENQVGKKGRRCSNTRHHTENEECSSQASHGAYIWIYFGGGHLFSHFGRANTPDIDSKMRVLLKISFPSSSKGLIKALWLRGSRRQPTAFHVPLTYWSSTWCGSSVMCHQLPTTASPARTNSCNPTRAMCAARMQC